MNERGNILILGLTNLDVISKCEGYPIEDTDQRIYYQTGGNAHNNCTILTQLGNNPEFIGSISKDWKGKIIMNDFEESCIIFKNCPIYNESVEMPSSIIILNTNNGSRTIRHCNPNFPEIKAEYFINCINKQSSKQYHWIHFEGRRTNMHEISKMMNYIANIKKDFENEDILPIKSAFLLPILSVEIEKPSEETFKLFSFSNPNLYFIGKDYATSRGFSNMELTVHAIHKDLILMYPHRCHTIIIVSTWGNLGSSALFCNTCSHSSHCTTSLPQNEIPNCQPIYVEKPAYDLYKLKCHKDKFALHSNNNNNDHLLDTLGAGDTFNAAFIHSISSLMLLKQYKQLSPNNELPVLDNMYAVLNYALAYANYIAGLKCVQVGLKI